MNTRLSRNSIWSGVDLVRFGREFDQPGLDRARGVLRRHAVDVGTGRRRGRRRVRHLRGGGRGDLHALGVDAELLGDHLRDLDVEPLPHLGAAVVQVDRAVLIDVHQRAGLIEMRGGERDAEFHRRERDAALQRRARGVERLRLAPALAIVARRPRSGRSAPAGCCPRPPCRRA